MKAAVYNGLFSASDPMASLSVDCPTGNCTWPLYSTLAVCSSCVSMTEYMTRWCPEASHTEEDICGWKLPSGMTLDRNSSVFGMTRKMPAISGSMPYSNIMRLVFMGTEAQNGTSTTKTSQSTPWALQCTFEYCVQTLNSSVLNGVLTEHVTSTSRNTSVLDIASALKTGSDLPVSIKDAANTTYTVDMGAALALQQWFNTIFRNGTASRNKSGPESSNQAHSNILVNLTVGISSGETFFSTDIVQAFYWYYYEYPSGIDLLANSLAQSMSSHFRSSSGALPIKGTAFVQQSYVHVHFAWIGLPVTVVILTTGFLIAAICKSQRSGMRTWKSSALAMLFHGLDEETRKRCVRGGTLKGVLVRFEDGEERLGMVTGDNMREESFDKC